MLDHWSENTPAHEPVRGCVLVVDDTRTNLAVMGDLLSPHYRVRVANSGARALQAVHTEPRPDLILLDIMMPEMDGYDTMRAIRRIPKFKSLPIITLTAKAMKGDRDKCIAAGASDYITKPVNVAQLLSLMRVWLH